MKTLQRSVLIWLMFLLFVQPAFGVPMGYVPFAESYGSGFVNYWKTTFLKQDSIVMLAIGIGIVCVGILAMSGKWKK